MDSEIPPLDSYTNDHNYSSCGYFKFSRAGAERLPPQIEQLQSLLLLLLVISGTYLYLIPYFTKWQRNRRNKVKQPAK